MGLSKYFRSVHVLCPLEPQIPTNQSPSLMFYVGSCPLICSSPVSWCRNTTASAVRVLVLKDEARVLWWVVHSPGGEVDRLAGKSTVPGLTRTPAPHVVALTPSTFSPSEDPNPRRILIQSITVSPNPGHQRHSNQC